MKTADYFHNDEKKFYEIKMEGGIIWIGMKRLL